MIGPLKRVSLHPTFEAENKKMIAEILERRNPIQIGKEWRVVLDHDNPSSCEEYPDRAVGIEQDREGNYIKLRFPTEFIGKNEKGHNEKKTRKRMMWVPQWLLIPFQL